MNEPHETTASQDSQSEPDTVAEAIRMTRRLLRIVRCKRVYVITSLLIAAAFGGWYYLAAIRIYQASAQLLITQSGGDVWDASMSTGSRHASLLQTYERIFTSKVVLDGAVERLSKLSPEERIDVASMPRESWSNVLRWNLKAKVIRRTNIITLDYKSRSPRAAEAVLHAVVESYLDFMEKTHRDVSVEIVTVLENERKEKEVELRLKQGRLLEIKQQAGDLGIGEGTSTLHPTIQRVVRLNDSLGDVQSERVQLRASLAATRTAIESGDLRLHLLSSEETAGRELILNAMGLSQSAVQTMSHIQQRLLDNRARLETLRKHLGPTHPQIQELNQQIHNAEEHIASYRNAINTKLEEAGDQQLGKTFIGMIERRLADATTHEEQLRAQYKVVEAEAIQMSGRLAEMQIVENDVRRLSSLHDMLLDRIANTNLNQEGADVRIVIVDEPTSSGIPVSPNLRMVFVFCFAIGSVTGIAWAYLLDVLDDRFQSPDELKEQLGFPVLAMIRKLSVFGDDGIDSLQVHVSSSAVESEAFRTLRTTLTFSGQELPRLAVTSSEPSDGKTTVLANLAVSYAHAGKRTLLIDADLRRPGMTKLFQLRGTDGVSNILRGRDDVSAMANTNTQETGIEGLQVLASGPKPPNPGELLSGDRFLDLVAWAEANYDQVLVDCPPVMAASDAAIVGRLVDGMVLVVQPQKNHRRIVLRAAEQLQAMRVNVLGTVVNRVDESGEYGYGYGYGYGEEYGADYDDEVDATPFEETIDQQMPRRRSA